MNPTFVTLLAAVILASACFSTATPAALPEGCEMKVKAMSECLPAISDPPTNTTPSYDCCEAFHLAVFSFDVGGPLGCLCYLGHNSSLLGFPFNISSVADLFISCNGSQDRSSHGAQETFVSHCIVNGSPPAGTVPSATSAMLSGGMMLLVIGTTLFLALFIFP